MLELIGEEGIALHGLVDLGAHLGNHLLVLGIIQHFLNPGGNLNHQVFLGTACGDGWCSKTDTAGLEGATTVKWHHVLVHRDIGSDEGVLCDLTSQIGILRAQVNEHRVVVGTTADNAETTLHKLFGQHLGILLNLLCPLLELGLQSLTEGYGLGCDDMLQRTTLSSAAL